MRAILTATTVAVVLVLAGCGQTAPDMAEFRTELVAAGVTPTEPMSAWAEAARHAYCEPSREVFELSLTREHTLTYLHRVRIVVKHLCPDRLDVVDAALQGTPPYAE